MDWSGLLRLSANAVFASAFVFAMTFLLFRIEAIRVSFVRKNRGMSIFFAMFFSLMSMAMLLFSSPVFINDVTSVVVMIAMIAPLVSGYLSGLLSGLLSGGLAALFAFVYLAESPLLAPCVVSLILSGVVGGALFVLVPTHRKTSVLAMVLGALSYMFYMMLVALLSEVVMPVFFVSLPLGVLVCALTAFSLHYLVVRMTKLK